MVSVIMPVYNIEKYVAESIKSVQNQTYSNLELIIVNDGSTDNTENVAKDFLSDKRIKCFHQNHKGVSTARNTGIKVATGNYIAFLDGDDLWDPAFLEKLFFSIRHHDANLAYAGFDRLLENGDYKPYKYQYFEGNILPLYIQNRTVMHIGSILVNRKIIDNNNLCFTESCPNSEDVEFIMKLLTLTDVVVVKEQLMHYRKRNGSATESGWDWNVNIHLVLAFERVFQFAQKNYSRNDKKQVGKLFHQIINFEKYRFIWRMLKSSNYEEALALIYQWRNDLLELCESPIKLNHWIKCKSILIGNVILWKIMMQGRKYY